MAVAAPVGPFTPPPSSPFLGGEEEGGQEQEELQAGAEAEVEAAAAGDASPFFDVEPVDWRCVAYTTYVYLLLLGA